MIDGKDDVIPCGRWMTVQLVEQQGCRLHKKSKRPSGGKRLSKLGIKSCNVAVIKIGERVSSFMAGDILSVLANEMKMINKESCCYIIHESSARLAEY